MGTAEPASRRRLLLIAVAIAAVVGVLAWLFWPRPPAVDLIEVRQAPATRTLAVNGSIRPRLSVAVQPRVAGTLVALPFDLGDRVTAGTLLARIDDAPQRAAIAQAEAAVPAQAAQLAQAQRDLARFEKLGEFVTRRQREEARVTVRQATQELARLRAAVVQARELRERHEVRAPFAGIILERPVDPGQTVAPDTILYRLADLTAPEVTVEVDEIYAVELSPGLPATVTLPRAARPVRATIANIQPRVDPATGAREVRLRMIDPPGATPAGLTVAVNLVVDRRADAISIPRGAILQPDTAPRVRTVDTERIVAERAIRFIDWPAPTVIVTQGLRPGMRLLADPRAAPPGTQVRPRD